MQPIDEPRITAELIRARVDALLARLRRAAEAAARDPEGFRLLAVTKGFGVPVVRAAVQAGLTSLAENRVQEAAAKIEAFPDLDWHLIGRLQSNKARPAVRAFGTIHSVDSLELLARVERIADEEGQAPGLLLQVNVAREEHRAGFDPGWFAAEASAPGELVAVLRGLRVTRVIGLMTMAPFGIEPDEQRRVFGELRRLRDGLQGTAELALPELSMGMTADAEAAVAEGATLVRIGTAIFGPRPSG